MSRNTISISCLKKKKRFSAFEIHIRVMIQPNSARKASSETHTHTQTVVNG